MTSNCFSLYAFFSFLYFARSGSDLKIVLRMEERLLCIWVHRDGWDQARVESKDWRCDMEVLTHEGNVEGGVGREILLLLRS